MKTILALSSAEVFSLLRGGRSASSSFCSWPYGSVRTLRWRSSRRR